MRVEHPLELATRILAPDGLSRDQLEAAIATNLTRRVDPRAHIPVFLLYWTATANDDGTVSFHPDIYGWDAELEAALAKL